MARETWRPHNRRNPARCHGIRAGAHLQSPQCAETRDLSIVAQAYVLADHRVTPAQAGTGRGEERGLDTGLDKLPRADLLWLLVTVCARETCPCLAWADVAMKAPTDFSCAQTQMLPER